MTVLAREAQVVYGSFTCGGATLNHILRDIYTSDDGYELSAVDFTFTVVQDTLANFATDCAAVEAALRVPHQSLAITGLGTKSFTSPSSFNAIPTVHKVGHPSDSGLSRTYRCRIEVGRAADNSSSGGRRVTRTSINVSYGPQRRRKVTVSGEWTSLSGTAARDQYESQIESYGDSVTSGLGGTWKLLDEPQGASDDADHVIRISRTYEEILDTSVGGGDADIRAETFHVTRQEAQPGDTPTNGTVIRPATLVVDYAAWLEKESANLTSEWNTLRSRLIAKVRAVYGLGSVVVVQEAPSFDYPDNKISASMTLTGYAGNKVIECHTITEHDDDEGIVLTPVWNGDKFGRFQSQGPASDIRTVRITQKVLGFFWGVQGDPALFDDPYQDRGDLFLKKTQIHCTPERVGGARGGPTQDITTVVETRTYERAKLVKGSSRPPVPTPSTNPGIVGAGGGSSGGSAQGGGGTGGGRPTLGPPIAN